MISFALCLLLFTMMAQSEKMEKLEGVQEEWDGNLELEKNKVRLYWRSTDKQITIRFEISARSWIGLGWNPDNENAPMTNADMAILTMEKDGQLHLEDYWSLGYFYPDPDATNHFRDVQFGQDQSQTWFEFSRDWSTGDKLDKDLSPSENFLIWAYGDSNELSYHGNYRGYSHVDFHGSDSKAEGKDTEKENSNVKEKSKHGDGGDGEAHKHKHKHHHKHHKFIGIDEFEEKPYKKFKERTHLTYLVDRKEFGLLKLIYDKFYDYDDEDEESYDREYGNDYDDQEWDDYERPYDNHERRVKHGNRERDN